MVSAEPPPLLFEQETAITTMLIKMTGKIIFNFIEINFQVWGNKEAAKLSFPLQISNNYATEALKPGKQYVKKNPPAADRGILLRNNILLDPVLVFIPLC